MPTILWRIVSRRYQHNALDGVGAKLYGGRWNNPGVPAIYAATSKSQGLLELLSALGELETHPFRKSHIAIPIVVPNSVPLRRIELAELPADWRTVPMPSTTMEFGRQLLAEGLFTGFLLPSRIVYGEYIALINPLHKDFTKIIPAPPESIFWDDEPFVGSKIMDVDSHKDVFLCHASEDKADIVEPLYRELFSAGVSCWYDNAEIKWGDSITAKVNEGLSKSEYVIVVLSENFMRKNWPKRELMAALNKESSTGRVVVLPLVSGSPEFLERLQTELFLQSDKLFIEWKNNPSEIAAIMHDRLRVT